jgi:hypothetical protein
MQAELVSLAPQKNTAGAARNRGTAILGTGSTHAGRVQHPWTAARPEATGVSHDAHHTAQLSCKCSITQSYV